MGSSTTQQVAFTAYNVNNNYYTPAGSRVTFNNVETNIGEHLINRATFICPVDGLYFFMFNIMSYNSYDPIVQLRKNDALVVSAWADVSSSSQYVQASNAALITCSAGERVYLETQNTDYVFSSADRFTTFSGFLLSEN